MQPTSAEIRRGIFVPLTVGVFVAVLVFSGLVKTFGAAGDGGDQPPSPSVTTLLSPNAPRVILIERKFFPDSEFTERGVYKGPDAAAARLAAIPGSDP